MSNLVRWLPPENGSRWDRVRIYKATTQTGTFTLLKELDISYTFYWDDNGAATDWYTLTFYNSVDNIETLQTDAFNSSTVPAISPKQVRTFMALTDTQAPDDTTILSLMVDANAEMMIDINFNSTAAQKVALKFLTSSYVSQWRAQQIVNSGNVNFAIDGVSVQRPFKDFMEQAKYYRQMYDDFVWKFAEETIITTPIADSGYPDYAITLVEIMNGTNNARNALDIRSLTSDVAYIDIGT